MQNNSMKFVNAEILIADALGYGGKTDAEDVRKVLSRNPIVDGLKIHVPDALTEQVRQELSKVLSMGGSHPFGKNRYPKPGYVIMDEHEIHFFPDNDGLDEHATFGEDDEMAKFSPSVIGPAIDVDEISSNPKLHTITAGNELTF